MMTTLNDYPASIERETTRLWSYAIPVEGIRVETFLRAAKGNSRFYWQDETAIYAGVGIATQIMAWGKNRFETIQSAAQDLFRNAVISQTPAVPRLFGGFAFSPNFIPDNTWTVFSPAEFVLPHYQFTQLDSQAWLTLNVLLSPDEKFGESELAGALAERARELLDNPSNFLSNDDPRLKEIRYPMSFETWAARIDEAISHFQADEMQKVVLARVCELSFDGSVDVDRALAYLNQHYATCHRFLFESRPHHAFYGATPELLVGVNGDDVRTMGLAGSIKRGPTPQEDATIADQLLHDPKERLEHGLVVNEIRERLQPLVSELNIPETPRILKFSNIQHLYTPIHGRLKAKNGVLPLVELLHPTPALGGSPREQALTFIDKAEPVPRGWYAGPVGWITPDLDGAFAVAIRSAISQDQRVWLYAGAGIVPASIPQKEWDETALKFKPMLNALGVSGDVRA